MGESREVRKTKPPPEVKLPTAAELEAIQQVACQEGFAQGQKEGKLAGEAEGRQQGLQEGREEGMKLGAEQGRAEANAARQAEISKQLQQLQQIMSALEFPLAEIREKTEEAIVNLVLSISRAVVYRELQLDRSHIVNVVRKSLSALPTSEEQAIVYIHPDDAEFLQTYLPAEKGFQYLPDAQVMAGGCKVETHHTLLDFTVEKRFQTVVQQMLAEQSEVIEPQSTHDFTEHMGEMSDFHREVLESSEEAGIATNERAKQPAMARKEVDESKGETSNKGETVNKGETGSTGASDE